jgi:hypothetical protein
MGLANQRLKPLIFNKTLCSISGLWQQGGAQRNYNSPQHEKRKIVTSTRIRARQTA